MKTVELRPNANIPAQPTTSDRTEAAAIIGEIAERMIELSEAIGEPKSQRWIMRLACLFGSEVPRSAWVYLRLCTGDLSEITASHADHGAILHRSKQGEHKEHAAALRVIARHYPELRDAIVELERKAATISLPNVEVSHDQNGEPKS